MDGKEQIIELGRMLADEQKRGCEGDGLEATLASWCEESISALSSSTVRRVIESFVGYTVLDLAARSARVGVALEELRALFRKPPEPVRAEPRSAPPERAPTTKKPAAKKPAAAAKPTAPLGIDSPLHEFPGIGPSTAQSFRKLGVRTLYELLYHFPHRYDDYTKQRPIVELTVGEVVTVVGTVSDVRTFSMRAGSGIEVVVSDDSGAIKAVFYRQPWLAKQIPVGSRIVISGKVESYLGLRQMNTPDWQPFTEDELVHAGRLVPVHPLTKGLIERSARTHIKAVVDFAASLVPDHLPTYICERAGLLPLGEALAQIHFPADQTQIERSRRRLAFDEFLLIQLGVLQRKVHWQAEKGYAIERDDTIHAAFVEQLPFKMTGAQQRVLDEIFRDMARPVPMARLLQGDVGSGKTVVAAATAVQAIANGFQAAIMAPTEILAEQHYRGLKALLGKVRVAREAHAPVSGIGPADAERLREIQRLLGMTDDEIDDEGIRVALLTGSLGTKDRRRVLEGIADGEIDLVVGTHALITESVRYQRLGAVIVDEQHRFGVEQRQRLKEKGFNPHMLVMTATPIPRTLTLTIYGDLDTSVLDELPPGRQEIKTRWVTSVERDKAYKHIRREVARGRQAFVICPLVEESEKVDLPSAEEMYAKLSGEIFPDLRVALIHGRMASREKDSVMVAFRAHQFDILVATAVIEVGIDVPNATTMIIEGADRFGLAQLHQFRGRVGRGMHQSFCILVSDRDNEVTRQRLQAMEETRDGFRLAEIDLQLRGPGEFFGTRQSGTPDLKVAQLADTRLLHAANLEAQKILADDPRLSKPEHALLAAKVAIFWAAASQTG